MPSFEEENPAKTQLLSVEIEKNPEYFSIHDQFESFFELPLAECEYLERLKAEAVRFNVPMACLGLEQAKKLLTDLLEIGGRITE